ncbi:MAG: hypothetical protein NZT92_20025 [Abditibacteriales bacterium]|nr:hypothetical protein [Abditibacteriales bacterium]MDW8367871.1 hypothetical protein [Abditibacteriales bacterium]
MTFGLAAPMRPGKQRLAMLKVKCPPNIARASVDETRKASLLNCVETHLRLDEREEKLYEDLMKQPDQRR